MLCSIVNILVAILVIMFSFAEVFGGLLVVLFKKNPAGIMPILLGMGLFSLSIWWIFISIGVLELKKWARVNISYAAIITLPIAFILASKKIEIYGFVFLYLFYLIYFNLPKIKQYFQMSRIASGRNSIDIHSRRCPDCGKTYDLSWEKCINCNSQLVVGIDKKIKANIPRKDSIEKRISMCAFVFIFMGVIGGASVLMSFQSVKYQVKMQNVHSYEKKTSKSKSENFNVITKKKNIELIEKLHNQWFWKYSLTLSMVLSIMSISAGVGLYKRKDFGRKLGIFYVSLIVILLPYSAYVTRITYQLTDKIYNDMPLSFLNGIKYVRYLSLAFIVPFMCFIVWVFIVLRNSKVKEQFSSKTQDKHSFPEVERNK